MIKSETLNKLFPHLEEIATNVPLSPNQQEVASLEAIQELKDLIHVAIIDILNYWELVRPDTLSKVCEYIDSLQPNKETLESLLKYFKSLSKNNSKFSIENLVPTKTQQLSPASKKTLSGGYTPAIHNPQALYRRKIANAVIYSFVQEKQERQQKQETNEEKLCKLLLSLLSKIDQQKPTAEATVKAYVDSIQSSSFSIEKIMKYYSAKEGITTVKLSSLEPLPATVNVTTKKQAIV